MEYIYIYGIPYIWNLVYDKNYVCWSSRERLIGQQRMLGKTSSHLEMDQARSLPYSYQNKFQADQKFLKVVNTHVL